MRRTTWIGGGLLALLLLLGWRPLQAQGEEQRAVELAREQMGVKVGAEAIARSHVEVRPVPAGWAVIFREAYARCGEAPFWPGACRFGPAVFRDVYACVEREGWRIRRSGGCQSPYALAAEELCLDVPLGVATVAPTTAPVPAE